MNHVITISDVFYTLLVLFGIGSFFGIVLLLLWLMNPFRDGDR